MVLKLVRASTSSSCTLALESCTDWMNPSMLRGQFLTRVCSGGEGGGGGGETWRFYSTVYVKVLTVWRKIWNWRSIARISSRVV